MSRLLNSLMVAAGETGAQFFESEIETNKQETLLELKDKYAQRAEERAWARRQQELETAYTNARGLAEFEAGLKPKGLPPGVEENYGVLKELYKIPAEFMNAEEQKAHYARIQRLEASLAPYMYGVDATTMPAPGAVPPPGATGDATGTADGNPADPPWIAKLRESVRADGGKTAPEVVVNQILARRGIQADDPAAKAIREQVTRVFEEERPGLLKQGMNAVGAAAGAAVDAVSGYEPNATAQVYGDAATKPGAGASMEAAQSAGQKYYNAAIEDAKRANTTGVVPEETQEPPAKPSAADYKSTTPADQSIAQAQAAAGGAPTPAAAPEPEAAPKPGDVGKTNPRATSAGETARGLLDAADQAVVEGTTAAWDALGVAGGVIQEQGAKAAVTASEGLKDVQVAVADFLRGYTGTSDKAVNPEQAKADAIKIVGEVRRALRSKGDPLHEADIEAAIKALRNTMAQLRTSSPAAYRATKSIFEKQINELLNG